MKYIFKQLIKTSRLRQLTVIMSLIHNTCIVSLPVHEGCWVVTPSHWLITSDPRPLAICPRGPARCTVRGLPEVTLVYRPRDQGILAGVYGSAHMTRALLMHDIDSRLSYHRHASKKKILNPSRGVYSKVF